MRARGERELEGPRRDGDRKVPRRRTAVRRREPLGRRERAVPHDRIGGEPLEVRTRRCAARAAELVTQGRDERELRVRHDHARGFDRGLTGPAFDGVGKDAILRGAKPDDRHRGDREREHREHEGLTPIVRHGVHSINRAARPPTTSAGSPMNESGAAMA